MVLTVRLDKRAQRMLAQLAEVLHVTRSEVVRKAVSHYAAARGVDDGLTALERLKPYIGVIRSGRGDLSERAGERSRKHAAQRHARRPR